MQHYRLPAPSAIELNLIVSAHLFQSQNIIRQCCRRHFELTWTGTRDTDILELHNVCQSMVNRCTPSIIHCASLMNVHSVAHVCVARLVHVDQTFPVLGR